MKCRVRVKKSQLDYFRKLARNTDLEIQAYLVGKVVSPELTIIDKFVYTKKYSEQSATGVNWYQVDLDKVTKYAESKGLKVVGDIHSHPNYWPILSEKDYKGHVNQGQRISGICAIMNRKTKVCFWVVESALPCFLEYADA